MLTTILLVGEIVFSGGGTGSGPYEEFYLDDPPPVVRLAQSSSVSQDQIEEAWQHCKTKTRPFPSASPMWQPGWESCAAVWERYAPIEAERKRREQEAKDAEIKALINRAGRPK